MTQSQLVWSFESQSRVKVKVVKWCRKKWFDHNLMYIYHKQCEILQKKITETAQTFNFSDFPLILCGNGPKGTKTTQTQTLFSQIGTFFWGIQGIPSESWRPGLSENVVVFVAIIFWTRIMAGRSWVKFQRKKIGEWNRSEKRHGYNFAFQASI